MLGIDDAGCLKDLEDRSGYEDLHLLYGGLCTQYESYSFFFNICVICIYQIAVYNTLSLGRLSYCTMAPKASWLVLS